MKQELSQRTIYIVLGIVAFVVVAGAAAFIVPGLGSGPVVQPKPFSPPAGYKMPDPNAPIGAPSQDP